MTPVYDLTTGEPETARQSGELLWDRERERLKKREREAAASAVQQHSLAMVAREQTAAGLFTRSAFHLPSSYHSRLTNRNLNGEASGSPGPLNVQIIVKRCIFYTVLRNSCQDLHPVGPWSPETHN